MNGKVAEAVEEFCNNSFGDLNIMDAKKSAVAHRKHETSRKESEDASRLPALEAAYTSILRHLGEDTDREGLLRTPLRAAKAIQFLTKGNHETIDGEFCRFCSNLGWMEGFIIPICWRSVCSGLQQINLILKYDL